MTVTSNKMTLKG